MIHVEELTLLCDPFFPLNGIPSSIFKTSFDFDAFGCGRKVFSFFLSSLFVLSNDFKFIFLFSFRFLILSSSVGESGAFFHVSTFGSFFTRTQHKNQRIARGCDERQIRHKLHSRIFPYFIAFLGQHKYQIYGSLARLISGLFRK